MHSNKKEQNLGSKSDLRNGAKRLYEYVHIWYICIRTEKQKLSKKEIQIHVEQTSESLDVYLFDKILKRRLS